jgi:hypothetical protein
MPFNAAWINQETNVVDNIIVVDEIDLIPNHIVKIPEQQSANYPDITLYLNIQIGISKYINGAFTDENDVPLEFTDYRAPTVEQIPPKVL